MDIDEAHEPAQSIEAPTPHQAPMIEVRLRCLSPPPMDIDKADKPAQSIV
jgi:hypothetical protein